MGRLDGSEGGIREWVRFTYVVYDEFGCNELGNAGQNDAIGKEVERMQGRERGVHVGYRAGRGGRGSAHRETCETRRESY